MVVPALLKYVEGMQLPGQLGSVGSSPNVARAVAPEGPVENGL
jgi:hypothetical protein